MPWPISQKKCSIKPYIGTRAACEMYAVISLMYFRGLLGLNYHHIKKIFQREQVIQFLWTNVLKPVFIFGHVHLL